MYRFAEALVRWAERDIAAGLVLKRPASSPLPDGDDDQRCKRDGHGKQKVRRYKHRQHQQAERRT